MELVKGKTRKLIKESFGSLDLSLNHGTDNKLPIKVSKVRFYKNENLWYNFEIDIDVNVTDVISRFNPDRYVRRMVRCKIHYQLMDIFEKRCYLFVGYNKNTKVIVKNISVIRNETPKPLQNS
jgi:hypothetical protein